MKFNQEKLNSNSRLDELQAAFLREKLAVLVEWNQRREMIADVYLTELANQSQILLPFVPNWSKPVWHQFVIRTDKRDQLQEKLGENGVGTLIHYPIPPHLSGAYSDMNFTKGSFPIAEQMAHSVLSLPIGPHLKIEQAQLITNIISKVYNG